MSLRSVRPCLSFPGRPLERTNRGLFPSSRSRLPHDIIPSSSLPATSVLRPTPRLMPLTPEPWFAGLFQQRQKYGVPVWASRHPILNNYLGEVVESISEELGKVRGSPFVGSSNR